MDKKREKVLIVKLGYTETLEKNWSTDIVSLGDIFRTTAILHLFKDDYVVWLTTSEGKPLLEDNLMIDRLMTFDLTSVLQLQHEHFDVVVNFEKIPGVCAFTDTISAWRRYGFRFDNHSGNSEAYESSFELIANAENPALRRNAKTHWFEKLYDVMRQDWRGEGYVLGYSPTTKEEFDIGFNHMVGRKWPTKAWPDEYWKQLSEIASKKYSISWQESPGDIKGYIDWINKCRVIVTNDSLGLHLAIALKKKIVALFGSTPANEVHLFGLGEKLVPNVNCANIPCINSQCASGINCMEKITPQMVLEAINRVGPK